MDREVINKIPIWYIKEVKLPVWGEHPWVKQLVNCGVRPETLVSWLPPIMYHPLSPGCFSCITLVTYTLQILKSRLKHQQTYMAKEKEKLIWGEKVRKRRILSPFLLWQCEVLTVSSHLPITLLRNYCVQGKGSFWPLSTQGLTQHPARSWRHGVSLQHHSSFIYLFFSADPKTWNIRQCLINIR